MRTVNFRDEVLLVLASELGIDTTTSELNRDHAVPLTNKINHRLKTFLEAWNWPEWNVVEERAYRTVWRNDLYFYRAGFNAGLPDEIYYIPTSSYYRVLASASSDPPLATVPTNTTYFTPITLGAGDRYIATEQTCRRSIGTMLGVFNSNPHSNLTSALGLPFMPSERGIEVLGLNSGPTAWIYFKMLVPKFTSDIYDAAKVYKAGDLALFLSDNAPLSALAGEVYRARRAGSGNAVLWSRVPFPEFAATYVIKGAAGDAAEDTQAAIPLWAAAKDAYQGEVDKRITQGQTTNYNINRSFRMSRGGLGNFWPMGLTGWLMSLAGGSSVSELTNSCTNEWGDTMGPTTLTSNTNGLEYPFDLPAVVGQNFIDVLFADIGAPALTLAFEIVDDKFEYVGALSEIEVPGRPTIANRATTGYRAVTTETFGADAADYRYRGIIRGIEL